LKPDMQFAMEGFGLSLTPGFSRVPGAVRKEQPFQRCFMRAGKTVETVSRWDGRCNSPLKRGVNENGAASIGGAVGPSPSR
jgi:hypothetical protein